MLYPLRQRADHQGRLFVAAEDRGFEPLRAFTQHAFQACALGHYANPPPRRLSEVAAAAEILLRVSVRDERVA